MAHVRQQQLTVWGRERKMKKRPRGRAGSAHETAGKVKKLQLLYLALICFNIYFTCLTESVCV